MKEFIWLNYNLKVKKIYRDCFFLNNEKIKIVRLKKEDKNIEDIEKLFILSNELYYKKIHVNTFVLNKKGKCYTNKNNECIVLMKINDMEDLVELDYLRLFEQNNNLDTKNIVKEWQDEIDDFEGKLARFNNEKNIVRKTANYYIGLAENAVSLLNETKNINNESIGIKMNPLNYSKSNVNNPFNYFKISRMYNISLYIKNKIFTNNVSYNELDKIIKEIKTDSDEIALFSYMLYPDYYMYEIKEKINEEKIKKIVRFIKVYEKVLKYLKENMKKNKKIELFVWLN